MSFRQQAADVLPSGFLFFTAFGSLFSLLLHARCMPADIMKVKGETRSLNFMPYKWDTLSIPLTVIMITSQLKRNYCYSGIMMMLSTDIRPSPSAVTGPN